ncbi:MAG: low-specificity L-threonine aldolase [Dehalococcoidales bacterium]|nr:low-specificity L-threonine aldolase [Dehalococcoidales bacterium]
MKIIDLRSDTITVPTAEMRRAMYEAEVGDDVYGEDPTVNRLEQLAANMLGKEAALFTPSGTMSNLIAVLTHTHPGEEIILGSEAHIFWYEVGGASTLGGVVMRTVPNDPGGRMDPGAIEEAIRPRNVHQPQTTLLCLENTHNRCSGAVLTADYTATVAEIARRHDFRIHLDGARIFNAAVALGVPASELARPVNSVCFCVSKGLSAPVGSLLCSTRDFVERARKWRKMLGGGMRQAGNIAAAGIIALQKMIDRLAEDHANARRLAYGLANIPRIVISPERIQTNIVVFEPAPGLSAPDFVQTMNTQGVQFSYPGGRRVRAVTNRMVSAADIEEALNRVDLALKKSS